MAERTDTGNNHSLFGWSLINFSADSLRPYRDKMVGIVQDQTGSSSFGLLVRLAELGSDDAVNLVIRRLDLKRTSEFAAIAACWASAEAWRTLQPAVMAHRMSGTGNRLQEEESPLLLALVRFGGKSQAIDIVRKRGLVNESRVTERLNGLEPGFAPNHCQDWL